MPRLAWEAPVLVGLSGTVRIMVGCQNKQRIKLPRGCGGCLSSALEN